MARYNFLNTITGVESVEEMGMSELDGFIEQNPHMHQLVSTGVALSYSGLNGVTIDSGFRDVLTKIKKANHGSNINIPGIKRQRKL